MKNVVLASLVHAPARALAQDLATAPCPATARALAPARARPDRTATRKIARAQTVNARRAVATRATSLVLSYIGLFVYSLYEFVTSMIVTIFSFGILAIRINMQFKLDYTTCSFLSRIFFFCKSDVHGVLMYVTSSTLMYTSLIDI